MYLRRNRESTGFYPTNFEYHAGSRTIMYKHAPDEMDIRQSNRITPKYLR